jgi:hypothetical protein
MNQSEASIQSRVTRIEMQMERYTSELESEKATRARVNSDVYAKLDRISEKQDQTNRIIWMMLGGLGVLQIVIQFVRH